MMEHLWLKPLPWVVARCGSEVASDLGAAFVMIGEPWAFVVDGAMGAPERSHGSQSGEPMSSNSLRRATTQLG